MRVHPILVHGICQEAGADAIRKADFSRSRGSRESDVHVFLVGATAGAGASADAAGAGAKWRMTGGGNG